MGDIVKIDRPDWGPPVAGSGGRETPGWIVTDAGGNVISSTAPAPLHRKSEPAREREWTETANDKARREAKGGTQIGDAFTDEQAAQELQLDTETVQEWRSRLRSGVMLPKDAAFHLGLDAHDLAVLLGQQPDEDERKAEKSPAKADPAALVPTDGSDLPAELRAQWAKGGGVAFHLKQAQAAGRVFLDTLGDEASAFFERFDSLPVAAQTAIISHLSVPAGRYGEADDDQMEWMLDHDEGKELAKEWGNHARRNLATALRRRQMIVDDVPDADRAAMDEFIDSMTPEEAKALFKALVI